MRRGSSVRLASGLLQLALACWAAGAEPNRTAGGSSDLVLGSFQLVSDTHFDFGDVDIDPACRHIAIGMHVGRMGSYGVNVSCGPKTNDMPAASSKRPVTITLTVLARGGPQQPSYLIGQTYTTGYEAPVPSAPSDTRLSTFDLRTNRYPVFCKLDLSSGCKRVVIELKSDDYAQYGVNATCGRGPLDDFSPDYPDSADEYLAIALVVEPGANFARDNAVDRDSSHHGFVYKKSTLFYCNDFECVKRIRVPESFDY